MGESRWTAVVLSGGTSRRLGTDKSQLQFKGRTTLERVVDTLDVPIIVVGPEDQGLTVQRVQEDPPGGGPVAGIAAALPHVTTPIVGILATDMPFALVALQLAVAEVTDDVEGCLFVDAENRDQYLCAAYRTHALRRVMADGVHGRSMRETLEPLTLRRLAAPEHGTLLDIDTPQDLAEARRMEERDGILD